MNAELSTTAYRASRRAYEWGRLAMAMRHAVIVTVAVAAVGGLVLGARAFVWLPVCLVAVTFSEWRGAVLMKGARRGLLAGLASMLLPLSVLRPCCGIDAKAMGANCCVMPSACWGVGAAVGFGLALLLPKAPEGRRAEAVFGMLLGVLGVAVMRCSMLFVGETVGLLGGMAAAIVAGGLARAWVSRSGSLA